MYDLRDEIIFLSETALQNFILERIECLGLTKSWHQDLNTFVEEQYKKYPENTEGLHSILANHSSDELDVKTLDITALSVLLLYYDGVKKLYTEGFKDKVQKAYRSRFYDFQNSRNALRHYTERIAENEKEKFIIDELEAIGCVISFSILCEKTCKKSDIWKRLLERAYHFQDRLRQEKWFLTKDKMVKDLSPDSDFSDIEIFAERGNVDAQVLMGKMYYEGKRVKQDFDKAFMWFVKASRFNNMEAMYYAGETYPYAFKEDVDLNKALVYTKKSAELGYVPAKYKIATLNIASVYSTEEQDKKIANDLIELEDEEYPPALWTLGLCYDIGKGVEKNPKKALELIEKAAMLGYTIACEELADRARMKKDELQMKKWYEIAAKNNSQIAISALERYAEKGHF